MSSNIGKNCLQTFFFAFYIYFNPLEHIFMNKIENSRNIIMEVDVMQDVPWKGGPTSQHNPCIIDN